MATGLNPLNVQITPDGKLAIVNNIGGGQDGQVDTVGVIDLEASPRRVIDQIVVAVPIAIKPITLTPREKSALNSPAHPRCRRAIRP